LEDHKAEIEEICKAAKKEQELETKMKTIEEEWNEQVLCFVNYKEHGEVCLDKPYTDHLLEQLEDAQESLAIMLTSKYVTPLRNEVSSWSEKLKTIGEVLDLWIEVQEMWINCESVFSNSVVTKEMPAEAKRFSRVDKSWIRSQKQSYEMKSVLQCCLGSSVQENTKRVLLKDLQKELEICFKSLSVFLDKKRKIFPRFFLLSNNSLLGLLSRTGDVVSVKPYLSTLFSAVAEMKLEEIKEIEDEKITIVSSAASLSDRNLQRKSFGHITSDTASVAGNQTLQFEISEVYSADGDALTLNKRIAVEKGAELWLGRLKDCISDTLKRLISISLHDFAHNSLPVEELALKYPAQVCIIALTFIWTREVETSIMTLRRIVKLF
jgi:dynein heavy chain